MDVVELTKLLVQCETPSPDSGEGVFFIQNFLERLGAKTVRLDVEKDGRKTANLYAKIGNSPRVIAFAGHTDVVPPGGGKWTYPPYSGQIVGDRIYGRGVVDMKGAIAAFLCAVDKYLKTPKDVSIAFLITGDEEDADDQGTLQIIDFLEKRKEKIDACIIGEPSNPSFLGEMVKIGRRGSLSFDLVLQGIQGHVAYPENSDNPIPKMLSLLQKLQNHSFDQGYDFFDPTHLEITSVDVGNAIKNMIPGKIHAKGNIRFNPNHTQKSLRENLIEILEKPSQIRFEGSGESFLSPSREIAQLIEKACGKILNKKPILSTSGGTSDGRFIIKICNNLAEFGLMSQTAHKVDENVLLEDLYNLEKIYLNTLQIF